MESRASVPASINAARAARDGLILGSCPPEGTTKTRYPDWPRIWRDPKAAKSVDQRLPIRTRKLHSPRLGKGRPLTQIRFLAGAANTMLNRLCSGPLEAFRSMPGEAIVAAGSGPVAFADAQSLARRAAASATRCSGALASKR